MSPDPFNSGANPTDPQTWNAYGYVRGNPLALVDPSGMDALNPGDPNDPGDPCWDDSLCGGGGWPPPFPPPIDGGQPQIPPPPPSPTPVVIQNTTGVYAQGQWGAYPRDGETLGLPNGMTIPGPLSPQVLLGLGSTWDCSSGLCIPGIGGMNQLPAWLNNVTSIFGYDQNIPLPSCFGFFLSTLADNLNPFTFGVSTVGEAAGKVGSGVAWNATLRRMSTMPNRSVKGLFKDYQVKRLSKLTSALENGAFWIGFDGAAVQSLISEWQLMNAGGCQ